jgi:hypothetical protein
MKQIKTFESSLNEGNTPNDAWYKQIMSLESKGETLDSNESEKFVAEITKQIESQSGFEFTEADDNEVTYYLDTEDGIKIGVSVVKSGSSYLWKAMCSDSSLEDGGVDSEGKEKSLDDVIEMVVDFALSVDDTLKNG